METINKMKRQSTEQEKIFANHITDKRLTSKIYKEFIWISSNEMDETGAHYTEWSKPER